MASPPEPMPELRPIPSTGGLYLAGADGSVWRAAGFDARGVWRPPKRCATRVEGGGAGRNHRGRYLRVNTTVRGVQKDRPVHRLVAEAWLDGYHPLLVVHHENHDCRDNRPENLRCMTRAEHERLHGHDVTDVDVANAWYDFELRRDDPWPDPYAPERREAQLARPSRRAGPEGRRDRAAARLDALIGMCVSENERENEDGQR